MNYYLPPHNLYSNEWRNLSRIFNGYTLIDRTKQVDFGFEYTVFSEIPQDNFIMKPLAQIVDARAQEIVQHATKPILLMLSGGIDSTLVFCALLKTKVKFHVTYSDASVVEYPKLWEQIKNNEFSDHIISLINLETSYLNELQKEYHIVSGVNGDQTIGTFSHFRPDGTIRPRQLENYEDVLPPIVLEMLQPSIDVFPTKIYDFADFLWWFNFVFRYQAVRLGHIISFQFDTTDPDTFDYTMFFDTPDFQRWGMLNREEIKNWIRQGVKTNYKEPYKKYILDVLGDLEYYLTKLKEPSQADSVSRWNDIVIINDNGVMKRIGDFCK